MDVAKQKVSLDERDACWESLQAGRSYAFCTARAWPLAIKYCNQKMLYRPVAPLGDLARVQEPVAPCVSTRSVVESLGILGGGICRPKGYGSESVGTESYVLFLQLSISDGLSNSTTRKDCIENVV